MFDSSSMGSSVKDIRTIRDFLDVFPKYFLGLPPDREVEFGIEFLLGTAPVSIAPYRMAPNEPMELKAQLQKLLSREFIRPSVSHGGAPSSVCKEKRWDDGNLKVKKLDVFRITFGPRYGHYKFLVMQFNLTNAPTALMDLINLEFQSYLDQFIVIFINDIQIYSKIEDEHNEHLRIVLQI
ncbi:Retrovirus-related Pol polyprotein from transposon 17.6 [Gossypium australe]|uniref:Retrovirus-related Pol polyprotein from transposon 17.6 n=1 Tax=Gossypium australe TaxID=47621 RepID=A0A5B6VPP9_9ROSI|nr:Retrovirus-related Pol polyprotein from transposon 17.6 [Gossypium australe]